MSQEMTLFMFVFFFPEGVMRSKRRCVLEKKQPYSGDEWCSGPDTEEDEDKPRTAVPRESNRCSNKNTLNNVSKTESCMCVL